jgi:predicted ATPase
METHELESAKDYRLEKLHGSDLYLTPADARAEAPWTRASVSSRGARAASRRPSATRAAASSCHRRRRRLITLIDVLYDNGVGADRLGCG